MEKEPTEEQTLRLTEAIKVYGDMHQRLEAHEDISTLVVLQNTHELLSAGIDVMPTMLYQLRQVWKAHILRVEVAMTVLTSTSDGRVDEEKEVMRGVIADLGSLTGDTQKSN